MYHFYYFWLLIGAVVIAAVITGNTIPLQLQLST